jgi:hypothetical protein
MQAEGETMSTTNATKTSNAARKTRRGRANEREGHRGAFILSMGLALGTFAVWACGSSSSGDANSNDPKVQAKAFFTGQVYPQLDPTCKDCHQTGARGAPVFIAATADNTYTAMDGFPGLISAPSVSPIIQKGPHSGPALTDDQTTLVTQWLTLEVQARNLSADPGAPQNLRAAFKAFGGCMDYSRWLELKLDTIAMTDTDNNRGQCMSCHNFGMASMWLSGNSAETFLKLRDFPYVQRLVIGSVNDKGEFDGISFSRRILDKGNEAQEPQSNSHPRYALSSELSGNLTTFVNETISNMTANRCTGITTPDAGPEAGP